MNEIILSGQLSTVLKTGVDSCLFLLRIKDDEGFNFVQIRTKNPNVIHKINKFNTNNWIVLSGKIKPIIIQKSCITTIDAYFIRKAIFVEEILNEEEVLIVKNQLKSKGLNPSDIENFLDSKLSDIDESFLNNYPVIRDLFKSKEVI